MDKVILRMAMGVIPMAIYWSLPYINLSPSQSNSTRDRVLIDAQQNKGEARRLFGIAAASCLAKNAQGTVVNDAVVAMLVAGYNNAINIPSLARNIAPTEAEFEQAMMSVIGDRATYYRHQDEKNHSQEVFNIRVQIGDMVRGRAYIDDCVFRRVYDELPPT